MTHARAALLGNPSDGFGGATIAFELPQFTVEVEARRTAPLAIAAESERLEFEDAAALVDAAGRGDYPPEGPAALLMAAAKRFCERFSESGMDLARLSFELLLRSSSIPPQVGLAGSSAIVIAALRALCELLGREIEPTVLPGVALACETEELGIAAGLQDRVVQAYGGLVFMDFDPALVAEQGHGRYVPLDPELLPPIVVGYRPNAASDSGAAHAPMRHRFEAGEPKVVETMAAIAALAHDGREALLARDRRRLAGLMDRNLELRAGIYDLDPRHVAMVRAARGSGAAVNFAGSGGAVVALAPDDRSLGGVAAALEDAGAETTLSGTG